CGKFGVSADEMQLRVLSQLLRGDRSAQIENLLSETMSDGDHPALDENLLGLDRRPSMERRSVDVDSRCRTEGDRLVGNIMQSAKRDRLAASSVLYELERILIEPRVKSDRDVRLLPPSW